MSVRHETKIEFALDEARDLPDELISAEVKKLIVSRCAEAYDVADGIPEDNFELAQNRALEAAALLTDAGDLLVGDEKPVRSLRRRLSTAEAALQDFLDELS